LRLSTDPDREEDRARATIAAALAAGMTELDTAHAYARDATELGHNERLVASAVPSGSNVRITTKCGMARPDGRWQPDGRASAILASARASSVALGRAPDVLLLHAPDPRVDLRTSVRALLRAKEEGLAKAVGLSNVSRKELESLEDVPLAVVQVALGAYDDGAARGGVVAWCRERGITLQAHTPLGGPTRAGKLARDPVLSTIARRIEGATPAMVFLAYLLAIAAEIVPVVGARRPETAIAAVAAERIVLEETDLAKLDARFPGLALVRCPPRSPAPESATAEIVMLMGIAGAGKTRLAESFVARDYERLNRDTLGGTLDGIARRLEERLAAGGKRFVLDNTYVTRATRSEVLRVARAAGAHVRCYHLDTPSHETHVNVTLRMLERHGELLGGTDLQTKAKKDAGLFAPNVVFRMERQLERPSLEEGFSTIEVVPFERTFDAMVIAGAALPIELVLETRGGELGLRREASSMFGRARSEVAGPLLVFGWRAGADETWRLRATDLVRALALDHPVEIGVCAHADGPPVCWCRPPLPGLWVAFARRHGVDPRRSVLLAASPTHRAMAKRLGVRVADVV
jgi:aryl-alcohol dehydrogenase-like predicted oxidoreductase